MASKTVLVPIAQGSEELEAITIIDTLRRAGCNVTVASVEDTKQVVCSRGVIIVADELLEEEREYDLIVLPGGMPGAKRLSESEILAKMLRNQKDQRMIGAICAAPYVVLESLAIFKDVKLTGYPAFGEKFSLNEYTGDDRVVVSGEKKNVITSQGPGSALEFSLELVKRLCGEDVSKKVGDAMLAKF